MQQNNQIVCVVNDNKCIVRDSAYQAICVSSAKLNINRIVWVLGGRVIHSHGR